MTTPQPPVVPEPGEPLPNQPVSPYPSSPSGPYPPYQPQQVIVVKGPPTSGMAVASLVTGILGAVGGWCMFGLPCIFAIAFGHQALRETRGDARAGRGMAIAGLILGYVFVAPWAFLTFSLFVGGVTSIHP